MKNWEEIKEHDKKLIFSQISTYKKQIANVDVDIRKVAQKRFLGEKKISLLKYLDHDLSKNRK